MKPLSYIGLALLLLCVCACTDRARPVDPTLALAYTPPEAGDFRLIQNTGLSTRERLVLELVGPASLQGHGATLVLNIDPRELLFATIGTTDVELVQNGEVFDLGSAPRILAGRQSRDGRSLQVIVCQKGTHAPKPLNGPLLRIALALNPNGKQEAGQTFTLTAPAGQSQVLIGNDPNPSVQNMDVKIGRLSLSEASLKNN